MPDAFEQFAEIAKAINDGALQREMAKYRKSKHEHDESAAASEAAAVREMDAINEKRTLSAEIDRKTTALAGRETKLKTARTEFTEYRDAENARLDARAGELDARDEQLKADEAAAAAVLATKEETEAASAEVATMTARYEARLVELGLAPVGEAA